MTDALASLKGITSTNDDPDRCAVCSEPFGEGTYGAVSVLHACCGVRACNSCHDSGALFDAKHRRCSLCDSSGARSIGLLKKKAKKGIVWAQYELALNFDVGDGVLESKHEACRWYRKAAAQGHPCAMLMLGSSLYLGDGCTRDLVLAREYVAKAMMLDGNLTKYALRVLINIAGGYANDGNNEDAVSILSPLAKLGHYDAMHSLGVVLHCASDDSSALHWLECSWKRRILEEGRSSAATAYEAMKCCLLQDKWPQAKFWQCLTTKGLRFFLPYCKIPMNVVRDINNVRVAMRDIRNGCGGCGVELQGDMRKKCAGCKAYCYCSRACQKMHWNRKEGGHREECKEVMELKKMMKNARNKEAQSEKQ